MTNAMIMAVETQKLAEEGILKYTGNVLTGINAFGEEIEVKEIEAIHTVKMWNKLGYKVKKGEHAKAKFAIWFYRNGTKPKDEEDEERAQNNGRCYMKTASWFTADQVEPMPEKK